VYLVEDGMVSSLREATACTKNTDFVEPMNSFTPNYYKDKWWHYYEVWVILLGLSKWVKSVSMAWSKSLFMRRN